MTDTDTEAPFSVGPGVQNLMASYGDYPLSDEQFIILREGHQVSQTFGSQAVYYWLQQENRTVRCPFR